MAMEQKRQTFVHALEEQVKMREVASATQTQAWMDDVKRMHEELQTNQRLEDEETKRMAQHKKAIAAEMRQASLDKQESNAALLRKHRQGSHTPNPITKSGWSYQRRRTALPRRSHEARREYNKRRNGQETKDQGGTGRF